MRTARSAASSSWLPAALVGLCLILGFTPGRAQAQSNKLQMERLGFDRLPDLRVYITFVEGDGTPITGKSASDFKLLLDSAEQGAAAKLTTFDQTREPIYVMAVVQASGAMEPVFDEIKKGVRGIAQGIGNLPGSKMGILAYGSDTKRVIEIGTSSEAESSISKLVIDPEGAEPHLLDSLRTAIDLLNGQPQDRRKLVVLFSDGIDVNNEKKAFVDIGRKAEQSGVVIDTIGYAPFEPGKLKNLLELSKNSYGTERACKTQGEIGSRFGALVDEIQKQYVATFALSIQGDGKEHIFQVLHEAGSRPVYSKTVSKLVPVSTAAPAPVADKKAPSRWWLWALLATSGAGIAAWLLLRKKAPPAPVIQAPLAAPMPTAGKANKTIAIDTAGDVAMGWVMGLNGKYKDVTFKLKDRNVMGTASDCDIVIDDSFMSSHHCEIRKAEGGFKMVDLGSTNGIVVNDKKVRDHFLVDNDAFRLGRTEFKFKAII